MIFAPLIIANNETSELMISLSCKSSFANSLRNDFLEIPIKIGISTDKKLFDFLL